jgi:anti-sigma regulatory factor (Ser/Thr protein kinase)
MIRRLARSSGSQMRLEVTDSSHVGLCRREAQRLADAASFDATSSGRVAIAATELATNLIRHAGGGEMLLQPVGEGTERQIELLSIDRGPGIRSIERSLSDGYSTAGTAGTGLGAVRRLSATFDIHSAPGTGTVVLSRIASGSRASRKVPQIDFGAVSVAMHGELECGDGWSIVREGTRSALLVVDGLGHGAPAAAAAAAAIAAFDARPFAEPEQAMHELHRHLNGTRGAAAACALLDPEKSLLRYAGVGNIAGVIAAAGAQRGLLSHNGTLGATLRRAQQLDYPWATGSVLVMHSDGLSSRWSLAGYPDLGSRHPAVIAGVLYRDRSRQRDDATIIVASCPA